MKSPKHMIGDSAEHFVCGHLLYRGHQAVITNGFDYDILLPETNTKIQVKSANKIKGSWTFASGGANNRKYVGMDWFALVFFTEIGPQVFFTQEHTKTNFKELPWNLETYSETI